MSDELKVPKVEHDVELLLEGQEGYVTYLLFLNRFSRFQRGPETLEEYLNSESAFCPAKRKKDGEVHILSVDHLLVVRDTQSAATAGGRRVTVELTGGGRLELAMIEDLPEHHSRPLDLFNLERRFLGFVSDDRPVFVNRSRVVRVWD